MSLRGLWLFHTTFFFLNGVDLCSKLVDVSDLLSLEIVFMNCISCYFLVAFCFFSNPNHHDPTVACTASKGKLSIQLQGGTQKDFFSKNYKVQLPNEIRLKKYTDLKLKIEDSQEDINHKLFIRDLRRMKIIKEKNELADSLLYANYLTHLGIRFLVGTYIATPLSVYVFHFLFMPFNALILQHRYSINHILFLEGLFTLIPVVGPFISVPFVTGFDAYFKMGFLLLGGVLQIVGLSILIAGIVKTKNIQARNKKLQNEEKKMSWILTPWVNEHSAGLLICGKF